jgi:hypothetical protein
MKEDFPNNKNDKTGENGNYSIFKEAYKKQQDTIARLKEWVAQRREFVKKDPDEKEVEKINKELKKMEEILAMAEAHADRLLLKDYDIEKMLKDFDPDKDQGKA